MHRFPNRPARGGPHAAAVLALLAALPLAMEAVADDKDPFNLVAGINWQHDGNVFRVPGAINMQAVAGRSERWDNITTPYVGVRVDKQYSLQRFKLDYTITDYKYQNYNFLDFKAKEYKAAWLWALTPYLTGTLSADSSQSAYGFNDYKNYKSLNISTHESQHFEADLSPQNTWHILAGYTRASTVNTQNFQADQGTTTDGIDAGVKYVFSSGSVITLMGHDRKGLIANSTLNASQFYDTGFDEREGEARLDWPVTGKSSLNLRMAYVSREHNHFSQRNYAGLAGYASYTWTPTGKTSLALTASRALSSYQVADSSYNRIDTLTVSPAYAFSDKLIARGSASISERSFLGDGVFSSSRRLDTSKTASLGLEWKALRTVTLGANLQHSSRSSNFPGQDFTDTTASVSASLLF